MQGHALAHAFVSRTSTAMLIKNDMWRGKGKRGGAPVADRCTCVLLIV